MPTTRAIFGNFSLLVSEPGPVTAPSVTLRSSACIAKAKRHRLMAAVFSRQAEWSGQNTRRAGSRQAIWCIRAFKDLLAKNGYCPR